MFSGRLQRLQWGAGLAAGLCCLALGAMSLIASIDDYRRVSQGAAAFWRFERVSDAVNAVVAERAPANVLIAAQSAEPGKVAALEQARAETDRLLALVQDSLSSLGEGQDEALSALNYVRASLAVGRQLVDIFVQCDPPRRRSDDFRTAMEEMFTTATTAQSLRDSFGQDVIRAAPEISTEVFLMFAVGGLRDQAGRLGTYVAAAQREGGRRSGTLGELQMTVGRIHSNNRILQILTHALPRGNTIAERLDEVQRRYFAEGLGFALDAANRAGTERDVGGTEFAVSYLAALEAIDGLRVAIGSSARERLAEIGAAAFDRAAIASTLTALVCVILVATILLFRRALFTPLGRAREQAIAIARGDLSEPTAGIPVAGEVGDMLAGLHAIRDDQRWRRELEEQQAEMARRLKLLSETDALTGLLNRRAVEDVAMRLLGQADLTEEGIGIILFDVDRFKAINDTFGHAAGDEVLRSLARAVSQLLRPQDTLARFGGEEFLILLPGVALEEAESMARTLCDGLPALVRRPDLGPVTASFGVASRDPRSGIAWDTLVASADRRLYAAKKAGRNCVLGRDGPIASRGAA